MGLPGLRLFPGGEAGQARSPLGQQARLGCEESVPGHLADRPSPAARSPSVFGDIRRSLSSRLHELMNCHVPPPEIREKAWGPRSPC